MENNDNIESAINNEMDTKIGSLMDLLADIMFN